MTEINSFSEPQDAFPVPAGSIFLPQNIASGKREMAIEALKQLLEKRSLNLPLGPQLDLNNAKRLLILNRFAIQLVTSGLTADHIKIPLKDWFIKGKAPQFLLAANVDEENNIVWFSGVLSGSELEKLVPKEFDQNSEITLSIDQFKGGIDRLLRNVRLLDPSVLPRTYFENRNVSEQFSIKPIQLIFLALLGFGAFLLKPPSLNTRGLLAFNSIGITDSLRGDSVVPFCLISPVIELSDATKIPVSSISFDRPIIYSKDQVSIIKISSKTNEEEVLYEKDKQLVQWPVESPILPGEKFILKLKPQNSPPGTWAEIQLSANPAKNFKRLDTIINSLGTKESNWIRAINKNVNDDKNLSYALLFSDKSPQTKRFNQKRSEILNLGSCLKN